MKRYRAEPGFTLIELLVVVIIIAALAGMVLPRVLPRADEAKRDIARGEIAGNLLDHQFFFVQRQVHSRPTLGGFGGAFKPTLAPTLASSSHRNHEPIRDERSRIDAWKHV